MNNYEAEIFEKLIRLLERIGEIEKIEGKIVFSDAAILHISYAMENVSGLFGTTEEAIKRKTEKDGSAKSN